MPAIITVSTENSKPVANAGPDQIRPVGATVTLNGGSSSDFDGDVPGLTGLTRAAAKAAIRQAGLAVGAETFRHDPNVADGIVLG